nr:MAG TPA: hypothetical protein [Caudoviricetes sp.]
MDCVLLILSGKISILFQYIISPNINSVLSSISFII